MHPAPAKDMAAPKSTDIHKKRSDTGNNHTRRSPSASSTSRLRKDDAVVPQVPIPALRTQIRHQVATGLHFPSLHLQLRCVQRVRSCAMTHFLGHAAPLNPIGV